MQFIMCPISWPKETSHSTAHWGTNFIRDRITRITRIMLRKSRDIKLARINRWIICISRKREGRKVSARKESAAMRNEKIHRHRMTFRRIGSLQSWRASCLCPASPNFPMWSEYDRARRELLVSCEPLRIIIEEKPNQRHGSMYLLITSTTFLFPEVCFSFDYICVPVTALYHDTVATMTLQ